MTWISLGEALQRAMDEWHWKEIEEKHPTKVGTLVEWEESGICAIVPGEKDEDE